MESSNENHETSLTFCRYTCIALSSNDSSVVLNAFYGLFATADNIFEIMIAVGSWIFESGDQYLHQKS